MLIDRDRLDYLTRAVAAIEDPQVRPTIEKYLTRTCTECQQVFNDKLEVMGGNDFEHAVYFDRNDKDTIAVLIGCEGFWLIDPNLIGVEGHDNWDDWTALPYYADHPDVIQPATI